MLSVTTTRPARIDLAGLRPGLQRLDVGPYHLHMGAPRIDVGGGRPDLSPEIWRGGLLAAHDVHHLDGDGSVLNTTATSRGAHCLRPARGESCAGLRSLTERLSINSPAWRSSCPRLRASLPAPCWRLDCHTHPASCVCHALVVSDHRAEVAPQTLRRCQVDGVE